MADDQSTAYIYVVTNTVNGKQYVGQTWRPIAARWKAHCNAARTHARNEMVIVRAIRRYGESAFTVSLLRDLGNATQDEVDVAEREEIGRLDTLAPFGYNVRLGGNGGRVHELTKAKLSASHKALHRHHSEEHKARMSELMTARPVTWGHKIAAALKGRSFGAAVKGRPKSAEHRAKIGVAHRGRKRPAEQVARLAATLRGRRLTAEQRQKISDGLRRSGSLKGRVFSPEWKAKLSASRRKRSVDGRDPKRCPETGKWSRVDKDKMPPEQIPAHV